MEIIISVLFILPVLLLILMSTNYINMKKRFEVLENKILSYGKEFSKIEKAFCNVEEDLSSATSNIISNHNILNNEFKKENHNLKVRIESLENIIKHQRTDIKTIRKKYQQLYNDMYKTKYRNKQNI
jgi:hypothetical protein